MDKAKREKLIEINAALKALAEGKSVDLISDSETDDSLFLDLVENINTLAGNIEEASLFSKELSMGKLYVKTPSRRNIMASPFKQLQSQLSTLNYSMEQLLKGKIVNKINMEGELFHTFNELISKVACASTTDEEGCFALINSEEQKVNSWRYHQILLAINMLDIKVIEVDVDGKVVYANRPGKALLGEIEKLAPEHVTDDMDELIIHMMENSDKEKDFPIVKEIYDNDSVNWHRVTSDTFMLADDQRFYLHVIDDITDWKTNEKRLEKTANMDALTGAYNRRAGMDLLHRLVAHPSNSNHCLVFVDIDDLKFVNDTYGHNEGDDYIRAIADLLIASFRSSEALVRYGGDEFFVALKDCTYNVAQAIMRRIENKLKKNNESGNKPYKMSFSYGIEEFGYDSHQTTDKILEAADKKMYQNKMMQKER